MHTDTHIYIYSVIRILINDTFRSLVSLKIAIRQVTNNSLSQDRIACTSVATHSMRVKQASHIPSFERGESRRQVQDVE